MPDHTAPPPASPAPAETATDTTATAAELARLRQANGDLWTALYLLAQATTGDARTNARAVLKGLADPRALGWIPRAERAPVALGAAGGEHHLVVLVATVEGFVGEAMYSTVSGWHLLGVPVAAERIRYWRPPPVAPDSPLDEVSA